MVKRPKHWMAGAFANAHGQFKAKAKAAGMSTMAFAQKHEHSPGLLGEQARLVLNAHKPKKRAA